MAKKWKLKPEALAQLATPEWTEDNPGPADATGIPGTAPGGYFDQNDGVGIERYKQYLYKQYRLTGNIDPIPFNERTENDHRVFLNIVGRWIADYNYIPDGNGCINRGDKAFEELIQQANATRARIGLPLMSVDEFKHVPWCVPLTLGGGPRQ